MSHHIVLSRTQRMLLATADTRTDGSLLPFPPALHLHGGAMARILSALLRRELIEEIEVSEDTATWRRQGRRKVGVVITAAGRAMCADESGSSAQENTSNEADGTSADTPSPSTFRVGTKVALVVASLENAHGATLNDLISATGWLPHTVRATLTGLRKRGCTIVREHSEGVSHYRIVREV